MMDGTPKRPDPVGPTTLDREPSEPLRSDRITPPESPRRHRALIAMMLVIGIAAVAVAVYLMSSSGTDAVRVEAPEVSTPPSPPPAPRRLKASALPFAVTLAWDRGAGSGEIDHYAVYRNDELIASVDPEFERFVDHDVVPHTRYRYLVEAVGGDPHVEVSGTETRVLTPRPPLAAARVSGVFDVALKVRSSYGITGLDDSTSAWRVTAVCEQGACEIRLRDVNGPLPVTELARDGVLYEGGGSGHVGMVCGTVELTSSYDLSLRVVGADTRGGRWRATKLKGTFSHSSAAQLGCRSGGATYAIVASLVEGP